MPKSLISGGAGFVGLHLARLLHQHGHEVTLLDNFARAVRDAELESFSAQPGVTVLNRDLLASGAVDGLSEEFDYVFHLAALLGVENVRSRPYQVLTFNSAMLEQIILLTRRQKHLRRLLFSSTSEVYAGTLRHFGMPVPTPESTPLAVSDLTEPRTSYMLSKIYGEALCRYSGLPFTLVRLHNAYGPRMGLSHVIPELLKKAHGLPPGGTLEVYSVGHSRSFCYISDVVEMLRLVVESPGSKGEVLNIGSQGPELRIGQLAEVIVQAAGKPIKIAPMPETPGSPQRRAPDMSKTFSITGYRASVDIAEGVGRTYAWYRSNIFEGGKPSAI